LLENSTEPGAPFSYVGVSVPLTSLTLNAMKKMSSLSFNVLGDGNSYIIKIHTTDTDTEHADHYSMIFPTVYDEESVITVNVDDLMQMGYGEQAPLILDDIVDIQFMPWNIVGPFTLKLWDFRIFEKHP